MYSKTIVAKKKKKRHIRKQKTNHRTECVQAPSEHVIWNWELLRDVRGSRLLQVTKQSLNPLTCEPGVHTHARTHARTGEVWCCSHNPWSLFFTEGPAAASPHKTAAGAPFCPRGPPQTPSLALITTDQFDNLIDCEEDSVICSPRTLNGDGNILLFFLMSH